jgi:hypothetical protein
MVAFCERKTKVRKNEPANWVGERNGRGGRRRVEIGGKALGALEARQGGSEDT